MPIPATTKARQVENDGGAPVLWIGKGDRLAIIQPAGIAATMNGRAHSDTTRKDIVGLEHNKAKTIVREAPAIGLR